MDNLGICRFHRGWAEEMMPEIMEALYEQGSRFVENTAVTASRIHSRNASLVWESRKNAEFVQMFLERRYELESSDDPQLASWIDDFRKDAPEAALSFWYEMHKGASESLSEPLPG